MVVAVYVHLGAVLFAHHCLVAGENLVSYLHLLVGFYFAANRYVTLV
jgi:hypothetical protein